MPDLSETPDLSVEQERLAAATYAGHDPEHLVAATVDGRGIVTRVRFAATADTRTPQALERAVLAAVAAAQRRLGDAWREIAVRLDPHQPGAANDPAIDGGIEAVFDPDEARTPRDGGSTRG